MTDWDALERELLLEIMGELYVFKPEGPNEARSQAFHTYRVPGIERLASRGYIRIVQKNKTSMGRGERVLEVVVAITPKGRQKQEQLRHEG